jgi:hypothetical protein
MVLLGVLQEQQQQQAAALSLVGASHAVLLLRQVLLVGQRLQLQASPGTAAAAVSINSSNNNSNSSSSSRQWLCGPAPTRPVRMEATAASGCSMHSAASPSVTMAWCAR